MNGCIIVTRLKERDVWIADQKKAGKQGRDDSIQPHPTYLSSCGRVRWLFPHITITKYVESAVYYIIRCLTVSEVPRVSEGV